MIELQVAHLLLGFIQLYLETFEAIQNYTTRVITALQVFGMFWYLIQTFYLCEVCIRWLNIFNHRVVDGYHELGLVPLCFSSDKNIYRFSGFTMQWQIIEIFLFTNFLITMFLLILRARFMNLRQDYLVYFRPEYLAMTINQILGNLPINLKQDKTT